MLHFENLIVKWNQISCLKDAGFYESLFVAIKNLLTDSIQNMNDNQEKYFKNFKRNSNQDTLSSSLVLSRFFFKDFRRLQFFFIQESKKANIYYPLKSYKYFA